MKNKIPPIPKAMQHMKQDHRGYPIPYTSLGKGGSHDFRISDTDRIAHCADNKLCAICAKKLPKDYFYFIGGPLTLNNKLSLDAPMHRTCAEFALDTCPHIVYEKAMRREIREEHQVTVDDNIQSHDKPKEWYLIKSDKYKPVEYEGHRLLSLRVVSYEKYVYVNGLLTKAT